MNGRDNSLSSDVSRISVFEVIFERFNVIVLPEEVLVFRYIVECGLGGHDEPTSNM